VSTKFYAKKRLSKSKRRNQNFYIKKLEGKSQKSRVSVPGPQVRDLPLNLPL
jgi:hypothetical protein